MTDERIRRLERRANEKLEDLDSQVELINAYTSAGETDKADDRLRATYARHTPYRPYQPTMDATDLFHIPTDLRLATYRHPRFILQAKVASIIPLDERPHVKQLELTAEFGAGYLRELDQFTELDALIAHSLHLESSDARNIRLPQSLRTLSFANNSLGHGVRELELPSALEELDISENELYGSLAGLRLPPTLRTLHIGNNNLGEEGLKRLALQLPDTLRTLNLHRDTSFEESTIKKYAEPLRSRGITVYYTHELEQNAASREAR